MALKSSPTLETTTSLETDGSPEGSGAVALKTSPTLETSTSLLTSEGDAVPEVPQPPAPQPATAPWITFGIGPAQGNAPRHPVTVYSGLNISRNLANGPTVTFTMPGSSAAAKATDGLASDLWVYKNGALWLRLRILPVDQEWNEDGDTPVTITAVGYKAVVLARHIRSGPPTFVNTDQGAIMWQLVQHTQSQVGGDLGIVASEFITGQLRDRTEYKIGDNLGTLSDALAKVEDGMWWGVDANLVFTARLWDGFATRADPIVHGANARKLRRQRGKFANAAGAKGAEIITTPVWLETDDLATDPRGLWEAFDASHSQTILQGSVHDIAAGLLADRQHPANVWTVELDPAKYFDGGSDYNEGEFVRIVVPLSAVDEIGTPTSDALCQVTAVSIKVDPSGATSVTLAAVELAAVPVTGPPPELDPPVNTVAPVLSVAGGVWTAGLVWSCSQGTWTDATVFGYAWQQAPAATGPWVSAAASDPGGNRSTAVYAPPVASAGLFYRCLVTAINAEGAASVPSNSQQSLSAAPPPAPVNTVAPAVTTPGSNRYAGEAWSCSAGSWSNTVTSFDFWWQQCATLNGVYVTAAASGAGGSQTSPTYVPPIGDAGLYYRCRVTANGPGGSVQANSNKVQSVAQPAPSGSFAPPDGFALWGATCTVWNSSTQSAAGYDVWRGFARRPADLLHFYIGSATGWDGTISATWQAQINIRTAALGTPSRLFVNWKIASNMTRAAVAAGGNDALFDAWCTKIKLWPHPIHVVFDHEAENAGGLNTVGNMPNDHADMIRHLILRANANGVTNVDWGWCPTGYSSQVGSTAAGERYNAMWPGSDVINTIWWDPYWQSANRIDWVLGATGGGSPRSLLKENVSGPTGWPGMITWARTDKTVGVAGLRYPFVASDCVLGIAEWGTWFEVNAMNGAVDGAANGLTDAEAATRIRTIASQYVNTHDVKYIVQYHLNLQHVNHLDGNPLAIDAFGDVSEDPRFNYDLALLE